MKEIKLRVSNELKGALTTIALAEKRSVNNLLQVELEKFVEKYVKEKEVKQ